MGGEEISYTFTKNGKVCVYWHGKHGKREIVLKGARAERLIRDLPGSDYEQQQLALTRATGNFKRGNERSARETTLTPSPFGRLRFRAAGTHPSWSFSSVIPAKAKIHG